MHKPLSIEQVEYKLSLVSSLWEVILERAGSECSLSTLNLLSLACDINHEACQSLSAKRVMEDVQ
ncbi:hypothetical protein [Yersinia enterocolitica]|uniref:Uncharacterized protein n=1 Tax=Yersinia enterocolitica TaxID=630 RepID=A0A9P1V4M5_YEREN|nr:hypothetical protein [Yersinia enterocolitica]CNG45517.1 Uncharacterised protein [Yersinia enterocolitica]